MNKIKKIYDLIDLLESESDDETKKLHEKISKIKEKWDEVHKKIIKEKNKKIKEVKQKALSKIKELNDPFELKKVKGDAEDIIDRIIEDYKEKTKKTMLMRDKEIDVAILEKRLKKSAFVGAAAFGTAYGGYKYYTYLQKRKEAEKQLGETYMLKLYEEYLANLNEQIGKTIAPIVKQAKKVVSPEAEKLMGQANTIGAQQGTANALQAKKLAALQRAKMIRARSLNMKANTSKSM